MYSTNMRRSLGILLIFAILFTVFPIGVFADEPEPPESETTVTRISAVEITKTPTRIWYRAGDTLDLSGLELSVTQEVYDTVTGEASGAVSYKLTTADPRFDEEFTVAPEAGTLLEATDTAVVITHTESGKSASYPITVAPVAAPVHGLSDGYYQADVTPWNATEDKASAMVNLLAKRAYIEVKDGRAEVTVRFIVGYPKLPTGNELTANETAGTAVREIFAESPPELIPSEVGAGRSGPGIKGHVNEADRSQAFQFELSSFEYPRIIMNTNTGVQTARFKFENITELAEKPEIVTAAEVKTLPKTNYHIGQQLDLTGLELILTREDGSIEEVKYENAADFNTNHTSVWPSNGRTLTAGHLTTGNTNGKAVTVSYGNFDGTTAVATFNIYRDLAAATDIEKIEMKNANPPYKTEFTVGEALEISKILDPSAAITVTFTGGSSLDVGYSAFDSSGFTVSPADMTLLTEEHVASLNEITITHTLTGKQVTYPITVAPAPPLGLADGLYKADVYGWHATNNAPSMMASALAKRAYIEVEDGKATLRVRFVPTSIFGLLINGTAIAEVFEVTIGDEIWNDPYEAELGSGVKGTDYPDKSRVFEVELKELPYQPIVYNVVTVGMITGGRFKLENITPISLAATVTKVEFAEGKSPKSIYAENEKLDLAGTELKLTKSDGSTETLTYEQYSQSGDFHLWPANGLQMLTAYTDITISYSNYDGTQAHVVLPVQVLPLADAIRDAAVTSMELVQEPTKKTYNVGESITVAQLAGLSVKLGYDNGVSATYSAAQLAGAGIAISPILDTVFGSEDIGTKTITLSHAGVSQPVTFEITVRNVPTIEEVTIKTAPTRTLYAVGETINTTLLNGLVVTVKYSDGSTQDFNRTQLANGGLTIAPTLNTVLNEEHIGNLEFTITHTVTEKTVTFDTQVKEAKDVIQTIQRVQYPANAYYSVGDKLDLAELQVTITYRDSHKVEKIPYADFSQYGLVATINNVPITQELEEKELALEDAGTLRVTSPGTGINTTIDSVVVIRADVKEIRIKTPPAKTVFTVGDNLLSGLGTTAGNGISFTIVYSDDTTKDATLTQLWPANLIQWWDTAYINPDYILKEQHVGVDKIRFEHVKSGTFVELPIAVKDYRAAEGVDSISIQTAPATASYAGQKLNFTGMVVNINYTDGTVAPIAANQLHASGLALVIPPEYSDILPESAAGTTVPVMVMHELSGKTAQVGIEIKSGNTVKAVTITANPTNMPENAGAIYVFEGIPVDLTGLKVTLEKQNGDKVENIDYTQLADYGLVPRHPHGKVFETMGTTTFYITHTETQVVSAKAYWYVQRTDMEEIRLKAMPNRTTYYVGEQINAALLNGLHIDLVYPEGKYDAATNSSPIATLIQYHQIYGVSIEPVVGTVLTKDHVGTLDKITFKYDIGRQEPLVLEIPITVKEPEVTGIAVKQAPAKVSYEAGEALDLTGLIVTLTKEGVTTEDVAFADFAAAGIAANPVNGAVLSAEDESVVITHTESGKTVEQPITVATAPQDGDGIYEINVRGWHATSDTPSQMAPALAEKAILKIQGDTITATIKFIRTTLFGIDIDGREIEEMWAEPLAGEVLVEGTGFTGIYNAADGSQSYTFEISTLNLPVVAGYVKTMKSIQSFRLNFDQATMIRTGDLPVEPVVVTAIAVKQAPAKVSYEAGEVLDLTGLIATLTKEDGTTEDVTFADFTSKGIAVSPANGTALSLDDTRITITHMDSGKTVEQTITVSPHQTAPDLNKPVELPAGVVDESADKDEVKVKKEELRTWLNALSEEEKATTAVAVELVQDAVNNRKDIVVVPVAVLKQYIETEDVAWLRIAKDTVGEADKQDITAALPENTKSVNQFDLKLQKVFANGDPENVHQLGGRIKIVISLTDEQLTEIAKGTAKLLYYNPETKELQDMNAEFADKTATFYTDHLSVYLIAVTTLGDGNPPGGGGGEIPLDPNNLSDGRYTISAKAYQENTGNLSMSNQLISGPLQLDVSGGTINVTMLMVGTASLPMKEVETLWYRDASGTYVEADKQVNEEKNAIIFTFPVESITKEQYMKVKVPMITDAMPSLPIFRLVFQTGTLKRGGSIRDLDGLQEQGLAKEKFVIKASAGEGGTITPSGDVEVPKGENQEFKIKANEGYKIKHVIVDGKSVGDVETYTFKNVEKTATISAAFEKTTAVPAAASQLVGLEAELAKIVFEDTKNYWAERAIQLVVYKGLFLGTGDNKFSPAMTMTRGMLVTVLGRLNRADVDGYVTITFDDVNTEQYYAKYIAWAAQKGIVNGVGDGKFAPDQAITREQLAVIFANYAKFAGINLASVQSAETTAEFADEELISPWAKESVALMRQSGLILGKGSNQFDPKGTATRAEIATILARVFEVFMPEDTQTDMQE